jgi:hypothetical protein
MTMVNNRSFQIVIFFTLLTLGIFLRIYHLGNYSLFSDERSSVLLGVANINQGGMGDLMNPEKTFTPADFWASRGIKAWFDADARGDVSGNSLLHDMLLKLFAFLFGKSDESMRSVSVLFNVLTLWLMYIWSKRIKPLQKWSLFILCLAVIEPFFVIYSQQVRNYATSLFFTTASNYFFWNLVHENFEQSNKHQKKWFAWILTSIGALFSTYLTGLVIVGQFFFLLILRYPWKFWIRMVLGLTLILFPLGLWMVFGPGQYFLQFQADAAEQLLGFIKANGEIPGWLELSTPSNIFRRTVSILSDQFLWTNDLYGKYGYKIGTIALTTFLFGIFTWLRKIDFEERKIYIFGLIQISLPVIFLFIAAIKAGTTSGFFLRYASFGLPFGIFISVGFLAYQWNKGIWSKAVICLFLVSQIYFLVQMFLPLYSDKPQKYTFSHDRGPNPYIKIADLIKQKYKSGDTVVYPSSMANFLDSKHMRNRIVDPTDAQNVNLYFSEKDQFIQRVDSYNRDSIMLIKSNGQKVLIFDFKKGKYRY